MAIRYRLHDFTTESMDDVLCLFERTYGHAGSFAERWRWEYLEHPRRDEIRLWVAQDEERLIGTTTRFPLRLRIHGDDVAAYHCANSLVDPQWRGQGIMTELYRQAADRSLILSRGTNSGMYALLLRFGNRPFEPDSFQTALLAPGRWLLAKAGLGRPPASQSLVFPADYAPVGEFGAEFDEFWPRAGAAFAGTVVKDAAYMNWRYRRIPHRRYQAYYRRDGGKIVALIVFRVGVRMATLVDVLWDPAQTDEPGHSVACCRRALKKAGLHKLTCWSTAASLRHALRRQGFFDRGEAARFSVFGDQRLLSIGSEAHFVHGDGDLEYL